MEEVLIATTNQGKAGEYQALLGAHNIASKSLADFKVAGAPKEDGATFAENALIKARYYSRATGLVALADDGGITIDVLHGEPGVKSRRWPGYEASDEELVAYTLKRLQGIPPAKRTARIGSVLAIVAPDGRERVFEAAVAGTIAEQPVQPIPPGLPFRALFVVQSEGNVWAKLSAEESRHISHRTQLVAQALPFIQSLIS